MFSFLAAILRLVESSVRIGTFTGDFVAKMRQDFKTIDVRQELLDLNATLVEFHHVQVCRR